MHTNEGKILVTGGAGYIGSHMVDMLLEQGFQVVVLDNLSRGFKEALSADAEFILGDVGDAVLLNKIFTEHKIVAVMHFAAFIQVEESVSKPDLYFKNNFENVRVLLDAMLLHNVKQFIFSSTAAVYGYPEYVPLDTKHPCKPSNPYGESKLKVENLLQQYAKEKQLNVIALRYFNAAGAKPNSHLGWRYQPVTHLIPIVLEASHAYREQIKVYGTDYETKDGSCVRDYIHVLDLCSAHLCALKKLETQRGYAVYNLGNGNGYTVREVIDAAKQVTGLPLKVVEVGRRPGDSSVLIADASQAVNELGWQPQYPELRTIVEHAWQWEQRLHP